MITVKIPDSQLRNVRDAMRSKSADTAREVQEVVKKTTIEMDGEVKELLNKPGTGRVYQIPTKEGSTRTHTASAPGQPPAKQYGFLIAGIRWEILGNRMTGRVRSQAEYSKGLEYGTPRVQARPFMRPAAEKVQPKFDRAIKKIFK